MPNSPLIQLQHFSGGYTPESVLHEVDWTLELGESWVVLGGNGAGKSALADALLGSLKRHEGKLALAEGFSPESDILALSFEEHRKLIEHDKRYDNSNEAEDAFDNGTSVESFILRGLNDDQKRDLPAVAANCGVDHILNRGIRFISTGESRRMQLARALLRRPQLLIIDNPYEGLDKEAQRRFSQQVEQLIDSGQQLLILLTDPLQIPKACDKLLVLENGRGIHNGSPDDWLGKPINSAPTLMPLPPALARQYQIEPELPLIETRHLQVQFRGQTILSDINWRLMPGQHCQITGPNGAGKSTLLGLLVGDNDKAYGQDVWLFGQKRGSGESIWDIKAKFGVVSTQQQLNHIKRQRVAEVVASGLYDSIGLYQDCSGRERDIALNWIRYVGLEPLAKKPFSQLSFGEQRLALLARAMVKSPLILILDEPCLGLDPQQRQKMLALIDRIAEGGDTQVLYISHVDEESPRCINQWLHLVTSEQGGYTAQVSE